MLYRRTAPTVRIRLPTSQAFFSLRKETLVSAAFGEEALLAPEATSASSASDFCSTR